MVVFEYAVVGKGLIGSAAARHLAMFSGSVVLIGPDEPVDKAAHQGVFASHYDEGRITRITDRQPTWGRLASASINRYNKIEDESGISFYDEVGCLSMAEGDDGLEHVETLAAVAKGLGADIERLDGTEVCELFPALSLSPEVSGVFQSRRAGFVSPRRLVAAQTLAAERRGATILRSQVEKIRPLVDEVEIETTDRQIIHARQVIVAAGAFTSLSGLVPVAPKWQIQGRIVALFELDEERRAALSPMPSIIRIRDWEGSKLSFYMLPPIQYPDGRWFLKIGSGLWSHPLTSLPEAQEWFRTAEPREDIEGLTALAIDMVPIVAGTPVSILRCATTSTVSGFPYVSRISPRITLAAGGNGSAAKSSDEIGRLGAIISSDRVWPAEYDQEHFATRFED